jgi:hypothetical protein
VKKTGSIGGGLKISVKNSLESPHLFLSIRLSIPRLLQKLIFVPNFILFIF